MLNKAVLRQHNKAPVFLQEARLPAVWIAPLASSTLSNLLYHLFFVVNLAQGMN